MTFDTRRNLEHFATFLRRAFQGSQAALLVLLCILPLFYIGLDLHVACLFHLACFFLFPPDAFRQNCLA